MGHRRYVESIIFIKFIKCCYFHYFCGPLCPTVLEKWCCQMICVAFSFTDKLERFWRHFQNLHFQAGLRQFQLSKPILSCANIVWWCGNNSGGAFWSQKPTETAWIIFSASNDDCLAQDRPRDLKLLVPHGNEGSEYVIKNVIACLWMKRQCKISDQFIKSLCDEIDVNSTAILLMSQRNVGTYGTQHVRVSKL